jgi:dUTP pyrophosphatase
MDIPVRLVREGALLPCRAYDHDAAFDLFAAAAATLGPQQRAVVATGIALGLPPDMAAFTLPRSGLAARHGITIVNAPGLIDPGYRGEVQIVLLNTDLERAFEVHVGDRIAQLLFVSLTPVSLTLVDRLDETVRGQRGFGSSGGNASPAAGGRAGSTPSVAEN